jgi:hypothetical protein
MSRPATLPALPARKTGPVAIVGVTVIPMTSPVRLDDHTVIVNDGVITALGPRAEVDTHGAELVDGTGRFVMPGLVDAHAHLIDFTDTALFLAAGVTGLRHMWGFPEHLAYARLVDAGAWAGPRLHSSSTLLDGALANGKPLQAGSIVISSADDADRTVPQLKQDGYLMVKGYSHLTGRAHAAIGRAAREQDIHFGGHCPTSLTFEQAMANGQQSFEHLMNFGYGRLDTTGRDLYDRIAASGNVPEFDHEALSSFVQSLDWPSVHDLSQECADRGVWNCPTVVVHDRFAATQAEFEHEPWLPAVAPHWRGFWGGMEHFLPHIKELQDVRAGVRRTLLEIIGALHGAGAPLLVGTDTPNPWVPAGFSVAAELEHFVAAGMSPYDALRCATVEPARFFGLPDGSGTVQVGQRADLIMLDADPLASISAVSQLQAVFVNGWLLERRDLDRLMDDAATRHAEPVTPVEVTTAPPAGAGVRAGRRLLSRILGVPSGSVAYRCCSLPNGDLRIDEVEETLGIRIEREVELDEKGALRHARSHTLTPVGSKTVVVNVDDVVTVRTDDHGHLSSDKLDVPGPVLPGVGVATTALAMTANATSGNALVVTRTGPRVVPVAVTHDEQITAVYDHWSVSPSPSFTVVHGAVIAGIDMVDTFPRTHEDATTGM